MNTVTITFSTIGYELLEPVNTSLLPVEYTVAPLKIATGRARIRRPTAEKSRQVLRRGARHMKLSTAVHNFLEALPARRRTSPSSRSSATALTSIS